MTVNQWLAVKARGYFDWTKPRPAPFVPQLLLCLAGSQRGSIPRHSTCQAVKHWVTSTCNRVCPGSSPGPPAFFTLGVSSVGRATLPEALVPLASFFRAVKGRLTSTVNREVPGSNPGRAHGRCSSVWLERCLAASIVPPVSKYPSGEDAGYIGRHLLDRHPHRLFPGVLPCLTAGVHGDQQSPKEFEAAAKRPHTGRGWEDAGRIPTFHQWLASWGLSNPAHRSDFSPAFSG